MYLKCEPRAPGAPITKDNVTTNDIFGLRLRASRAENMIVMRLCDGCYDDEAKLDEVLRRLNEGQ